MNIATIWVSALLSLKYKMIYNIMRNIGHIYVKFPFAVNLHKVEDFKVTKDDVNELFSILQPGDILLRRTDGYFSNIGIKGLFTHCGMYVGRTAVDAMCNASVIHMVDPICEILPLSQFCKCDAIAVYRPEGTVAQKRLMCQAAVSTYIAKVPYDSAFSLRDSVERGSEEETQLDKLKTRDEAYRLYCAEGVVRWCNAGNTTLKFFLDTEYGGRKAYRPDSFIKGRAGFKLIAEKINKEGASLLLVK